MKVFVVGNGPSAKNLAKDVDSCDVVVRMKLWWIHGSQNAGNKCDIWAHFGHDECKSPVPFRSIWVTQPVSLLEDTVKSLVQRESREFVPRPVKYLRQLRNIVDTSDGKPIRWINQQLWDLVKERLGTYPSTGFSVIAMLLDATKQLEFELELSIAGFDARYPSFGASYREGGSGLLLCTNHDFAREKQELECLLEGSWLGDSVKCHLTWHKLKE